MRQKATPDEMVSVVRDAEKPLTTVDIADRVGVTRQTINNYQDDLESHPEVTTANVAGSTTFWHAASGLATDIDDLVVLDGEIVHRIENLAEERCDVDERGISQSEAPRRIVEEGLDAIEADSQEPAVVSDGGVPAENLVALTMAGSAAFATVIFGVVGLVATAFVVTGTSLTPWDLLGVLIWSLPFGVVTALIALIAYLSAETGLVTSWIRGETT